MSEMEATLHAIRSGQILNRGLLIASIATSLFLAVVRLVRQEPALLPSVPVPTSIENNTNVGAVDSRAAPDRDWITVEEFGARNGIASRTVLSYIEAGRILPEPEKSGRAWRLAADSRIQP